MLAPRGRRTRPLVFLLPIALLAALLWRGPGLRDTVPMAGPTLVPAPDRPCAISEPLLTILVLDDSSSIGEENDPKNHRYAEARLLADYIRQHGCHPEDLLGVVQFASTARVSVEPTAVRAPKALEHLRAALADSKGALGRRTNLEPALQSVRAMMSGHPRHKPTVVLFTDGLVGSPGRSIRGVVAEVARLPAGSTHLVAVGPGYRRVAADWEHASVGLASVHALEKVRRGSVAQALVEIFLQQTRAPR